MVIVRPVVLHKRVNLGWRDIPVKQKAPDTVAVCQGLGCENQAQSRLKPAARARMRWTHGSSSADDGSESQKPPLPRII